MIFLLVVLFTLSHFVNTSHPSTYNAMELHEGRNFSLGTNPHLQTIFIGRCYAVLGLTYETSPQYEKQINVKERGLVRRSMMDEDPMEVCTKLYALFEAGFRFLNDSNILPSSFQPFFTHPSVLASLHPPVNTGLFWSGVSDMIPTYQTAAQKFVMETSGIIGIVGDLMWCGSPTAPSGYDYKSCVWGDFNQTGDNQWHGAWVSYWAAASLTYAPLVSGNITILLRGSPNAFRPTSFFGTCELPNLPVANITGVQVLVVPPSNSTAPYEQCGEGSLVELVGKLESIGISSSVITCIDDPPLVKLLLCLQTPDSPQCMLM